MVQYVVRYVWCVVRYVWCVVRSSTAVATPTPTLCAAELGAVLLVVDLCPAFIYTCMMLIRLRTLPYLRPGIVLGLVLGLVLGVHRRHRVVPAWSSCVSTSCTSLMVVIGRATAPPSTAPFQASVEGAVMGKTTVQVGSKPEGVTTDSPSVLGPLLSVCVLLISPCVCARVYVYACCDVAAYTDAQDNHCWGVAGVARINTFL